MCPSPPTLLPVGARRRAARRSASGRVARAAGSPFEPGGRRGCRLLFVTRPMIRRVTIEGLAPTGEGVARTPEGVGFVAGALPGEEVDAEVVEVRKKFWKGSASRCIRIASPDCADRAVTRDGCAGCDWAHLDLGPGPRTASERSSSRRWSGSASCRASPSESCRSSPRRRPTACAPGSTSPAAGVRGALGFFAPAHAPGRAGRSLRGALATGCARCCRGSRAAVAESGAAVSEIATVETPRRLAAARRAWPCRRAPTGATARRCSRRSPRSSTGSSSRTLPASLLGSGGRRRLWLPVGGREFPADGRNASSRGTAISSAPLSADVAREAASIPPGRALDAFGGVGSLRRRAPRRGARGRHGRGRRGRGRARPRREEALGRRALDDRARGRSAVHRRRRASPSTSPSSIRRGRASAWLAAALPRAGSDGASIYVSCDPATLARDLASLVAGGPRHPGARLYDLFPFTHRVEAVVTLDRPPAR